MFYTSFLLLSRLDLVRSVDTPAFRHRDMDGHCSQTSGCVPRVFSSRLPQTFWSWITTHASSPGPRICRGGRCTFERDVPPHTGVLVWGQSLCSARSPQAGPLRPDDGEAGRGLVWTCCGGTHPQVGLRSWTWSFYLLKSFMWLTFQLFNHKP